MLSILTKWFNKKPQQVDDPQPITDDLYDRFDRMSFKEKLEYNSKEQPRSFYFSINDLVHNKINLCEYDVVEIDIKIQRGTYGDYYKLIISLYYMFPNSNILQDY